MHNRNQEKAMSVSIEVPDDVRNALEGRWGDLSRHLRENMAVDGRRRSRRKCSCG